MRTELSHLVSVAKWLSVCLLATTEWGFTFKFVRDMTRTYSQMESADEYSQHSSIIWSVWSNRCVFIYELSGSGFESSYSHLNFRFGACFEQGVPQHSSKYSVWIHLEMRTWHGKNIESNGPCTKILKTQLNHMVRLAKWLSVRLRTKWFWVWLQFQ